jgi:hypothetical protein
MTQSGGGNDRVPAFGYRAAVTPRLPVEAPPELSSTMIRGKHGAGTKRKCMDVRA